MEGFQTEPFPVVTGGVWTAGSDLVVNLMNLPDLLGDAIAHVMNFDITLNLTPTYTTAPTNVGNNNAVKQVQLFDGSKEWLQQSGFNALRAFERLEAPGKLVIPDPLTNGGTGTPRYVRRRFSWGPPSMKFADSVMPCSQLNQGGQFTLSAGALLDLSGDCTACTGTYDITANLIGLYELRFAPWYERIVLPLTNGTPVAMKALYAIIAAINSTSYDAFAAGDIGTVTIDGVLNGTLFKPTKAQQLTMASNADAAAGQLDGINGDPANATNDVAMRQANLGTPTALTAQALDLQQIQGLTKDARLTKLPCNVPSAITITVSGSNAQATQLLFGRYRPLTAGMAADMANRCFTKLPNKNFGAVGLRLGSKKQSYKGTRGEFFPKQVLLNKAG